MSSEREPATYINRVVRSDDGTSRSVFGKFALIKAGTWLNLRAMNKLFDAVPNDPYVAEGFRYKCLSRVSLQGSKFVAGEHQGLFQSTDYNPTHGDIVREYSAMPDELLAALQDPIRLFWTAARLEVEDEILVQAQRITASGGVNGDVGQPTVEGFHQDDVDIVGILVISRWNIRGGISMLSYVNGLDDTAFAGELEPGDLLVLNDREIWHYTSPISRLAPDAPAYRDVVLFGWPSARFE